MQKLTEGLKAVQIQNNKNNEFVKLQYTNKESQLVLTVGKKEFNHANHQSVFLSPEESWVMWDDYNNKTDFNNILSAETF